MGMSQEDLQNLRISYKLGELRRSDTAPRPIEQFDVWFHEAVKAECDEPNAFVLSTSLGDEISSRVVLFKGIQEEGLIFYSNYDSPKAKQMQSSAKVAANFLWLPLQRQVRIQGIIEKASAQLSDEYFKSRPRGSQIGAIASPQGSVVKNREELEEKFKSCELKYQGLEIPRPSNWGGFIIKPTLWEFWQGRENRMHDRICYRKVGSDWIKERLAP
ncbi:MAG: pyridoxamine 5'-phosphate oxidase [Bacteriovoracaceae bacterium]|nr:pyridoxamine 5'-phosphate oxidase [Bacteriovoracaceae bacterium]